MTEQLSRRVVEPVGVLDEDDGRAGEGAGEQVRQLDVAHGGPELRTQGRHLGRVRQLDADDGGEERQPWHGSRIGLLDRCGQPGHDGVVVVAQRGADEAAHGGAHGEVRGRRGVAAALHA